MDTMIGVDLAKSVFQLHGASMVGEVKFRKKLTRPQFERFMAEYAPAVVVMEACGGAHFWARRMLDLGHEVRLVAPQYVRPFVKRQKNDAADAEAIVIAAQRPEKRFVEPKTVDQQARATLFRGRERLVRQRTELINALRGVLYEHGHVFPTGARNLGRIEAFLIEAGHGLHPLVHEECMDMLDLIQDKTARIAVKTKQAETFSSQGTMTRRLKTIPGVGALTALAVETFAPPMESFKSGRDFAAWLGIVPRQHSSGGKQRLGKISKAGQGDIRRLLIMGAMTRLTPRGRLGIPPGSWLARMLERKPKMLVAIALANKMARQIWALLTKQEDYREPVQVVA
ncbi:IS110 family transposase [Sedimentitalea sp. JM2-8]|uniref:IS110 family transposase n=1 Tax=Sedimentitalea xiamensis TaxID=3050037 RepID=A0ABT7FLL4_9RHOB|nr:IS110 family transposase [Sedimentitalea xiamensis]MDK3075875.1 IS110 family transposase [Sedimentitalea xiamensis]